jgi:hypothetical protein
MSLRTLIAILFLALQAVLVVRAQFVDARHFCWAPHTTQVRYSIETVVRDQPLTRGEIRRRYRIPAEGWDAHSWRNVIDVVAQYERTYGRNDGARVRLRYSVNGRQPKIWTWPDPDPER